MNVQLPTFIRLRQGYGATRWCAQLGAARRQSGVATGENFRRNGASHKRHCRGRGPQYPPILPNEAICNVKENAFISLGEKGLCRLQKNDNWLRFLEMNDAARCPDLRVGVKATAPYLSNGDDPRSAPAATAETDPRRVGGHGLQRLGFMLRYLHDRNGRDARSTYGGRDAHATIKD
jgi:hypothetical protein